MNSDPVLKAKALEEKALNRAQEARDKAKMEKAMLWDRIQKEVPEMALFLKEVNRVFGKPARLKISFKSDGER